jgi:hypothetical protein
MDVAEGERMIPNAEYRPKTLDTPDHDTLYCDVKTARFTARCCKILAAYPNGDCVVQLQNGVQFTAIAPEIFSIRKGDYHAEVEV